MKTLTNIRSLMACVALAATVPAVIDAQTRPNMFGQPTLDRSAQIEAVGTEPALVRIRQLADSGEDWQAEARKSGMMVKDDCVLVEFRGDLSVLSEELGLIFSGDPT